MNAEHRETMRLTKIVFRGHNRRSRFRDYVVTLNRARFAIGARVFPLVSVFGCSLNGLFCMAQAAVALT